MKKLSLGIGLTLLLALGACGGGGGGSSSGGGDGGTTTPPVSTADAFFTKVLAMIGISSDSTEPVATDSLAATTPDNTEPAAVN